jgi:uncharacterized protein
VKLSFKELAIEPESFEGSCSFEDGDFKIEVESYQADFVPTDAGLYADIRFEYSYKAPCDKCLEETEGFGSERSGVQLMHQPKEMKDEAELGDDDMGIIYIEDDEIDLEDIVRQEVVYHLPVRMVCGEDCKGLCQQCGANLNTGKCKCDDIVDPRWSGLKGLKK